MRTVIALALSLSLATASYGQKPAPDQGAPPRNLKQATDGRWTANADPANAERFEVHVVKAGDTLSQIAAQYLNNLRLWPQLWEMNEHIVNPHWIYPDDKILIRQVTQITEAPPAPTPAPGSAPEPEPVPPPMLPPPPSMANVADRPPDVFFFAPARSFPEIKASDLYCSGFIQEGAVPRDLKVISKHNASNSALASQGDYVFLNKGAQGGLANGAILTVVRPTRKVDVPISDSRRVRSLGTHFLEVGHVQIVMSQNDFATARVVHNCEAIEIGDILVPFQRVDFPEIRKPRAVNTLSGPSGPVMGSVAITRSVLANFGSTFKGSTVIPGVGRGPLQNLERGIASEGQIVYVDIGQAEGVKPGDSLLVYRPLPLDRQLYKLPAESAVLDGQRSPIGELIILKVNEKASTAIVTYSSDAVSAGDSVVRR